MQFTGNDLGYINQDILYIDHRIYYSLIYGMQINSLNQNTHGILINKAELIWQHSQTQFHFDHH